MKVLIAIGKVAKLFGVTTQTIRNWSKQGILKEYRTIGGHRRYDLDEVNSLRGENKEKKKTVVYTRVSSYDQKEDLERQTQEVEEYCKQEEIEQVEVIKDIGSGLNYNKRGLKKLIHEVIVGNVARIVVSFQDRLLRFGSEILFQICELMNVEVVILNEKQKMSFQEKLVEDVLAIMTVFCSKIYGQRSHEKRKKRLSTQVS